MFLKLYLLRQIYFFGINFTPTSMRRFYLVLKCTITGRYDKPISKKFRVLLFKTSLKYDLSLKGSARLVYYGIRKYLWGSLGRKISSIWYLNLITICYQGMVMLIWCDLWFMILCLRLRIKQLKQWPGSFFLSYK